MSTNHAKDAVEHVSQALDSAKNEGDQVKAFKALQDEIERDTKGMNTSDQKAYMAEVTKELEKRGQLPALALAMANDMSEPNRDYIKAWKASADYDVKHGRETRQLDQALLKYLSDNYDKLSEAHSERYGADPKISKEDITAKLSEFRTARDAQHRKDKNQAENTGTALGLLGGGEKSLFDFIDGGNKDGRVTKKELEAYLSNARASGSTDGHYSKDKQALVEKVVKEWDDRDKGKWMRGGFNGDGREGDALTKQGLIEAAGKRTETDLFAGKPPKPVDPPKVSEMEVKQGDSYWAIAGRILGNKASNADILAKTKELQAKNGDVPLYYNPKNPQKIKI